MSLIFCSSVGFSDWESGWRVFVSCEKVKSSLRSEDGRLVSRSFTEVEADGRIGFFIVILGIRSYAMG